MTPATLRPSVLAATIHAILVVRYGLWGSLAVT